MGCRTAFSSFLIYSRTFVNIYCAVEFIAITTILFKSFGNAAYISGTCLSPWTSLFMVMLMDVVIFATIQDIGTIDSLYSNHEDYIDEYSTYYCERMKSDDLNILCCKGSFSCLAAQSFIVWSISLGFRLWNMCLFIIYTKNKEQYAECYTTNMYKMMIATSSILLLVVAALIVWAIVLFFWNWCCKATANACEKMHKQKIERERETNLEKVREAEQKTKEMEKKLEETKIQIKQTKDELTETKFQLTQLQEHKQNEPVQIAIPVAAFNSDEQDKDEEKTIVESKK